MSILNVDKIQPIGSGSTVTVNATDTILTNAQAGVITATRFDGIISATTDDWITHQGDSNTKFGFSATDTFAVETAGSERIRIDSSGHVIIANKLTNSASYTSHNTNFYGGNVNTGGVRIEVAHSTTSVSGNTASASFPHHLLLSNYSGNGSADNRMCSIGFDIPTTSTHANAVIAYQATAAGTGDLQFHLESGNSISEKLRITSTGVVSINDSTPETWATLQVNNHSTHNACQVLLRGADQAQIILRDDTGGSNTKCTTIRNDQGDLIFGQHNDAFSAFTERVRITSTGDVGINCTPHSNAGINLQIHGDNTTSEIRLTNTTTGNGNNGGTIQMGGNTLYISNSENDKIAFETNGSERLRITGGGNVQIDNDSGKFELGADQDISFYHTGTHGFLENDTGTFYIKGDTISLNKANGGNVLWTNGSEMRIYPQDVGFGGAVPGGAPAGKNVFLAIGDSDTGIVQDGDGQLELWANNNEVANINAIDGYTSTKPITTSGDITASGGAGAITLSPNADIRLQNGTWTGDYGAKIQHHDNYLFLQGGSNGVNLRNAAGSRQLNMSNDGHFGPANGQTYNLGSSSLPWAAAHFAGVIYATGTESRIQVLRNVASTYQSAEFRNQHSVYGGGVQFKSNNTYGTLEIVNYNASGSAAMYNSTGGWHWTGNLQTHSNISPWTDNTHDVGSSSKRWDDVYATNGSIQTSDRNEKNTIVTSDLGLSFINKLKPVSYKFNDKTRTHYGLIAQDVETVLSDISKPSSGFAGFIKTEMAEEKYDDAISVPEGKKVGDIMTPAHTAYGLRYNEFIAPLIKAIQELSAKNDALESRIAALEGS